MDTVIEKVYHTITEYSLILPEDAVFIGLSGGADSMCMFHVLLALKDRLRYRSLHALHLHHGIRGEEADRDVAFVTNICQTYHVPLTVKYVNTCQEALNAHETIEEAGRRLRYQFFFDAMNGVDNAKMVTAHHADDQLETVLFHIVRGCGLKGLSGIPIRRGPIIRPLLFCTRNEVLRFCELSQCGYVIDETNLSSQYTRNRIRQQVVPVLESIHPRAKENVLRLSSIAKEENDYLDAVAAELLHSSVTDWPMMYQANVLLNAPQVIAKRALRMLATQHGCSHVEQQHVEEMYVVLRQGGACNLPDSIVATRYHDVFYCDVSNKSKIQEIVSFTVNSSFRFGQHEYCALLISRSEYENLQIVNKNVFNFCCSYDMIKGDLVMRTRQNGDMFRPYRRCCTKSLKKWFCEQKIPPVLRDVLPIVSNRDGVVCLPGLAVDERYAVNEQTGEILYIEVVGRVDGLSLAET